MDERLAAVLNAGVDETTLPSGMAVRGVRPTVEDLIRRRLLPDGLRKALVASAATGKDPDAPVDDEDVETAITGIDYLDRQAAAFIQEYRFDARAAWRPVEVSVEQFRRMAPADREALVAFVRREEEAAALAPFRDVDAGPADGAGGPDVANDAERPAARSGRRRGVRAG